jgi:hypothetical protein
MGGAASEKNVQARVAVLGSRNVGSLLIDGPGQARTRRPPGRKLGLRGLVLGTLPTTVARSSFNSVGALGRERTCPRFAGLSPIPPAGFEPAISCVKGGKPLGTECADLLGVSRGLFVLSGLVRRSVCRDFSGVWSALGRAWTSGGVAVKAAPLSSEHERFEGVSSRS